MPGDRTHNGNGSAATRSAVTNASRLIQGVDGRSALARRFRDVHNEILADLGGADFVSEGERQLARRAAALAVYCETLEAKLANGEPVDSEDWVRVVNALNRTFASIGLRRRARRTDEPRLHDVLHGSASA
jgi:hypothetical protein